MGARRCLYFCSVYLQSSRRRCLVGGQEKGCLCEWNEAVCDKALVQLLPTYLSNFLSARSDKTGHVQHACSHVVVELRLGGFETDGTCSLSALQFVSIIIILYNIVTWFFIPEPNFGHFTGATLYSDQSDELILVSLWTLAACVLCLFTVWSPWTDKVAHLHFNSRS